MYIFLKFNNGDKSIFTELFTGKICYAMTYLHNN